MAAGRVVVCAAHQSAPVRSQEVLYPQRTPAGRALVLRTRNGPTSRLDSPLWTVPQRRRLRFLGKRFFRLVHCKYFASLTLSLSVSVSHAAYRVCFPCSEHTPLFSGRCRLIFDAGPVWFKAYQRSAAYNSLSSPDPLESLIHDVFTQVCGQPCV